MALSSLLGGENIDKPLEMPRGYAQALQIFENHKDKMDKNIYDYYSAIFNHELKEFEENFTKWEVTRIY